jgi:Fur family ferric uptake transcriptional regulator
MERRTRQRAAIQDVVNGAPRPLSAAEIHELAEHRLTGIGIATVYRTIKSLIEAGEVVTVSLPGDTPRYERAALGHHHHFHCRSCGRVFEMHGCPKNLAQIAPRGFEVDDHEVVLYGRCRTCA